MGGSKIGIVQGLLRGSCHGSKFHPLHVMAPLTLLGVVLESVSTTGLALGFFENHWGDPVGPRIHPP